MTVPLYITCLPGLEEVLGNELTALGYSSKKGGGGVWVSSSSFADVMKFNLLLRTATRVLLPLFDIERPSKKNLYNAIFESDIDIFFENLPTFCIDVPFAKHPDYSNTHYVAQLAKDAICDLLKKKGGSRPSIDTKQPEIRFSLIVMPNKAILYFDTSGEPLFKRGYRQEGGEAPLKENLAAALLLLAGYTGDKILVDPCCGSGTFLIEAALLATNTPPGIFRKEFGFFKYPYFEQKMWDDVKEEAKKGILKKTTVKIFGIEKDERTYMHLRKAVMQAGVHEYVTTFLGDFKKTILPEKPSFLISNPPFGIRLGKVTEHAPLYKELGDFMKQSLQKPATAAILSSSVDLLKNVGIQPQKTHPIFHGGLDCFFSIFPVK
jgi:putative N6-adenine-specific DNA methylase